jgi:hypothetical protein
MSNLGNKETFAKNLQYYMAINNMTRNDLCEDQFPSAPPIVCPVLSIGTGFFISQNNPLNNPHAYQRDKK